MKKNAITNPVVEEFFFDDPWFFPARKNEILKTDIEEKKDKYVLSVDLPGFKKNEIKVVLDKGYLSITATKKTDEKEKDDEGKIIRRERSTGVLTRSFYVGDYVKEDAVTAKYEEGVLKLVVPKTSEKEIEKEKLIEIK